MNDPEDLENFTIWLDRDDKEEVETVIANTDTVEWVEKEGELEKHWKNSFPNMSMLMIPLRFRIIMCEVIALWIEGKISEREFDYCMKEVKDVIVRHIWSQILKRRKRGSQ